MNKRMVGMCLALLLCMPLIAQDRMSKAEFTAYAQQQLQIVNDLWRQKKIDAAIDVLERLNSHPQIHEVEEYRSGILYNIACGYSLIGNIGRALAALGEAIDAGYSNSADVLRDTDLAAIRADPRFSSILAKLRIAGIAWESSSLQSRYRDTLSEDEKVVGLSRIWTEVKYNFAYFDRRPLLDWDSLYVANLSEAKKTKSTAEYYRLLQKMCARLGDGHTGVNVPRELFPKLYSRPPVDTRLLDDKVMIVRVLDDDLEKSGIKPGQEILKIDGIPVRQYVEERVEPYVSSSTEQSSLVQTYEYYLLGGAQGSSIELELKDPEGSVSKKEVRRTTTRIQSFSKPVEFKLLDKHTAYVALNTYANRSVVPVFDSVFAAVRTTDALILDLRENTGGNSDIGYKILGYLTDKPFSIVKGRGRGYSPFARAMGRNQRWDDNPSIELQPNGAKFYPGRVVVLISARTGSAAEDFCVAFRTMKRGDLIGTPTAGSTGQPLFYSLPGGGSGFVCTLRTFYPDGKEFVGIGIEPDILVNSGLPEILSGRDITLDEAVSHLRASRSKEDDTRKR